MKLCNEKMFQCIRELLECEKSSNGLKATAVYFINSLIHNNGKYIIIYVCISVCIVMYICMLVCVYMFNINVCHFYCACGVLYVCLCFMCVHLYAWVYLRKFV